MPIADRKEAIAQRLRSIRPLVTGEAIPAASTEEPAEPDIKTKLLTIREKLTGQRMVPSKSTEFSPDLSTSQAAHAPLPASDAETMKEWLSRDPSVGASTIGNTVTTGLRALDVPRQTVLGYGTGLPAKEALRRALRQVPTGGATPLSSEEVVRTLPPAISDPDTLAGVVGRTLIQFPLELADPLILMDAPAQLLRRVPPSLSLREGILPAERAMPRPSVGPLRPPLSRAGGRFAAEAAMEHPPVTPESLRTTSDSVPTPPDFETLRSRMEEQRDIGIGRGAKPGHVQKKTPGGRPDGLAQALRAEQAPDIPATSEAVPEIPRPVPTLSEEMTEQAEILKKTRPGGRPGHVQKKTPGSTPEELAAAFRGESRASVPPKSESMPEIPRPQETLSDEMAEYHRFLQEVFQPQRSEPPGSSGVPTPPPKSSAFPTGGPPEIPPRPGEPVELFAGFPVEPTRLSKAVDGLIAALTPAGRVPRRGEWLRLRDRTFGFMGRWEGSIDRVFDPMKNWPEETKKSVFRFLDGELPIDQVPEAARRPARSARRMLDQVGAMLVDRGLIEREAYERLKGQYVRYLYAKHLLPDEAFKAAGGPSGRLNLKALRGRKDLSDDARDALGLIEDPHIAGKVGLSQSIRNVGLADYLQSLSSVPDWVHPGSFVDLPIAGGGTKRAALGELRDEVNLYREMAKRNPRNAAIQNHLASLQAALDDANARLGEIPRGFVLVPNSPEWGPLRGTFLRKEIFQDLRPMFQIRQGTGSEILDAVLKGFRGTTAAFKVAKVPLNLPTAATNVVSNFFQGAMSGVPVHKMPRLVGSSLREMLGAAKGDRPRDWNRAMRGGLFNRTWSVGELNEVLGEWGQLTNQSSLAEMVRTTMKLTKYYGKIDDVFKLAWFKSFREAGMSEADAVSEAMKWGMDYSLVHPSVRWARQHVAPFISYQANLLPLLAESLKKRPWVVLGTAAFPWVVAQGVKEYHDLSEEDWRKIMQSIPTYLKKNPTEWALLPVKDPQGNWQWVNFGKFTPWGNIIETAIDVKQGEYGPAVSRVSGNPWLGVYSAFRGATGGEPPKDPFFGIPIYSRLDPPRDKFFKTLDFVYNQWAPSMLTRYGAAGKTVNFMTGTKDRYGRVPTVPETAGRWVGVNIARPTPEQAQRERAHHIFEAREDLIKILRARPGKEKEDDARRRFQERLREIRGE